MKVAWRWWRRGNEDEDDVNPNVFWIKLTKGPKQVTEQRLKYQNGPNFSYETKAIPKN